MLTVFLCVVLVLCVIILLNLYVKLYYSRSIDDPPGNNPQIFFGNLVNSGALTGRYAIHEIFSLYQRKYGDVFLFWLGPHRCPVFCLPEHAKTIFSDRHTFERSPLFIPNFDLLCPHSIINLTDAKWKRHARVMLPMFKRAKILPYRQTIVQCVDRFIDTQLEDKHIYTDLVGRCQLLVLNIIALIAFDYDLETAVDSPLRVAFEDFAYYAAQFSMALWLPRWLGKVYLKLNWKYQRALRLLRELSQQIVEQEQNKKNENENERPKNLIASLVSSLNEQANDEQTSSGLNQVEMFDEVLTAIVAGSETTSTALSWFIFYMTKYPQVQQNIKQELEQHNIFMEESSLTPEILDTLVYCDCVTKEVSLYIIVLLYY
jgi:pentalenene oxygenase